MERHELIDNRPPWPWTLRVTDGETGAPGEVIDICDGWRVRVQWSLNNRITRVPVERLRLIDKAVAAR